MMSENEAEMNEQGIVSKESGTSQKKEGYQSRLKKEESRGVSGIVYRRRRG